MQTRRRRKQATLSILQLPDSYLHQLIIQLTPDSKLAFRATCKALQHAVDGTCPVSTHTASASSQLCEPCSSVSKVHEAVHGLRLLLASRRPSMSVLHGLDLLHNVVVLNTQTAGRGAISIGCTDAAQQLANGLPRLKLANINNSQASLVDMLVYAAPQLSSLQLSITSNTPKVMSQLGCFTALTSLELLLLHPAWLKGCAGLGDLTQLQRLMIIGKPLCEASKHGEGAVSGTFWEENIRCLIGLTSLHVNPWIKSDTGCVTYSTLTNLCQLHVPYSSGKCGLGATSAMLSQLHSCSHLTSLCFGAHEFNWDVSHLSLLTQLRQLEIHNPFLKEVWGLQPFTAAALAPLTAATGLTSLTLSHLRLPLLTDTMATAGQAVAAVAAQPGAAAALADALASGDGPAADIVHAIAAAAVATALRGAAAAVSDKDNIKLVWNDVADTLQQQAAAAVAAATAQLPAAYGSRAAAAGLQALHLPATAVAAAAAAEGNIHPGAVAGGPSAAAVAPEMLALAHEVIAAMAKHTALRLPQQQREQQQQQQKKTTSGSEVCDELLKQQYLRAAHALAASVGPVVAAAAAAGAALPGGQLPAYLAVPPPPGQALAAAHLAAQVAGGNPLAAAAAGAAAAALAGPPLGFVAVPAVPPPLLPPPPPPVVAPPPPAAAAAAAAAPVPVVGIPAAVPAAGLAAVSAAAAEAAAAAATSAANASARMLVDQVPVLVGLKRLTVGTTHGRLFSGVQLAALAPGLTCFEDLSEIPRIPSMAPDILGGLDQLSLLTVNVDTLQLYARHASLTGLRGLNTLSSSGGSDVEISANGNAVHESSVKPSKTHASDRQPTAAAQAAAATEAAAADPDKAVGKAGKKTTGAAGSTKAAGKKKPKSRGSRTAAKAAAAAAGGSLETLALDTTTTTTAAAASEPPSVPSTISTQDIQQPSAAAPITAAAGVNATTASHDNINSSSSSSSVSSLQASLLHLGSSWRQLSNLRCLRLLMLGHLCSGALSEVRLLPTLPGVTRLELCSAFAGSLAYAETYTIEEDPHLWQEQVGVEELVVDGGVLLGGFMVDAGMAALLKQKLTRLRRLVLCRCLDLTVDHVQTAMQRRLAPVIVVKRDCAGVTEADVVRLNQQSRAAAAAAGRGAVVVEYEDVKPCDYEGKAFTYAIDE